MVHIPGASSHAPDGPRRPQGCATTQKAVVPQRSGRAGKAPLRLRRGTRPRGGGGIFGGKKDLNKNTYKYVEEERLIVGKLKKEESEGHNLVTLILTAGHRAQSRRLGVQFIASLCLCCNYRVLVVEALRAPSVAPRYFLYMQWGGGRGSGSAVSMGATPLPSLLDFSFFSQPSFPS